MDPSVKATNALSSLTLDQSKQFGKKPTMQQAGEAFEALFMQTIMKTMREAKLDDGLFGNDTEKPFQSMLDGLYAELSVKRMDLGIGKAIERQFTPDKPREADPLFPKKMAG
jgi:flagellar protein FlgJ